MKFYILPVKSDFWLPGTDYCEVIIKKCEKRIENGDFIIISEKAISVAIGNISNESTIKAGSLAVLLTHIWMRVIWGYFLGIISRLSHTNIKRLRKYPRKEGSRHKQLCLWKVGFFHSLKHWSEGGIDTSNLPGLYVSLPLRDANVIARSIRDEIQTSLKKKVMVIIADSDKTYSFKNVHFCSRHSYVKKIHNWGPLAFIFGRAFKLKPRSTPIGVSDQIATPFLLNITALSNKVRGYGAGATIWDIASRFHTTIGDVTYKNLKLINHFPIVIIRIKAENPQG